MNTYFLHTWFSQLFISRLWYTNDYDYSYNNYRYDYDYSGNVYDFLYIFLVIIFITCFQEWDCDQCGMRFNFKKNYQYHVKCCSGLNRYKCDDCGNVYNNKRTVWQHIVKQHGKDVCCLIFFLWRICIIWISHIYYSDVQWTFIIIYILMYCIIGSGTWQ